MYILTQVLKDSISTLTESHLRRFVSNYFDQVRDYPTLDNYRRLFEIADLEIKRLSQGLIVSVLESMDVTYRNSPNRKEVAYVKDVRSRTLWTFFGPITFHRTVYQRRDDKTCFIYLDEFLGLPKYIKYDPTIRAMVLSQAAHHNSLIKLGEMIGTQCFGSCGSTHAGDVISRQTIRNILHSAEIRIPLPEPKETPARLYIMADEKYIGRQGNGGKKQMVKCAVAFEKRDISQPKRPKLIEKYLFASTSLTFWEEFYDLLGAKYDMDKVREIVFMGDGARWIQSGIPILRTRSDQKIMFYLDHFHYKQALRRFSTDEMIQSAIHTQLLHLDTLAFRKFLADFPKVGKSKSQLANLTYISKFASAIKRMLLNPDICCSMESKISHEFAAIFTSVPKGYSEDMLARLLNLRVAYRNRVDLRTLSFQWFSRLPKTSQNSSYDFSFFESKKNSSLSFANPVLSNSTRFWNS